MRDDGKLHFSDLKRMSANAQTYQYWLEHEYPQSAAMRFGQLVHAIILGGEYVVYDGERRGLKWAAFAKEHADADLIVTASEHERAAVAASAILNNLAAITMRSFEGTGLDLLQGQRERAIDWVWRGRPTRSTLDVLGPGRIVDLKISSTACPERWQPHATRMAWNAQLAFYCCAVTWMQESERGPLGTTPLQAYAIAAESKPPHCVTVHRLTERNLEEGLKSCIAWTEHLNACEASGVWPGYSQSEIEWDAQEEAELVFGDEGETADEEA